MKHRVLRYGGVVAVIAMALVLVALACGTSTKVAAATATFKQKLQYNPADTSPHWTLPVSSQPNLNPPPAGIPNPTMFRPGIVQKQPQVLIPMPKPEQLRMKPPVVKNSIIKVGVATKKYATAQDFLKRN